MLEEELRQYRSYLKETVLQYKKQVFAICYIIYICAIIKLRLTSQIHALRTQLAEASRLSASAPLGPTAASAASLVVPEAAAEAVRSDKLALSPIGDGGRKRSHRETSSVGTGKSSKFADAVISASRSVPVLRDAHDVPLLDATPGDEYEYGQMTGAAKSRLMSAPGGEAPRSLPQIAASALIASAAAASRTAQGGARPK